MKKFALIISQIILSVAIIGGGIAGAKHLIRNRKKAEKVEMVIPPTLVEVVETQKSSVSVDVPAMGTVMPAFEVTITPEVTGRIVHCSPNLVAGGKVNKGETLVRLDEREYKLAVKQQEAAVERAWFDIKVEEGRQVIAKREWELVGSRQRAAKVSKDLTLRKPHLDNARAALSSARSGLDRAKLNVERTILKSPFNAIVVEEFVDVGQVLTPQTKVARLVGRDKFWVRAALPVEKLSWFDLPDKEGQNGADVTIEQDTGDNQSIIKVGKVVRLLGDIDPTGRLARVIVAVDNPLDGPGLPLLLGAYVNVRIKGITLNDVVTIPRKALHQGDRVYVMNDQDKLEIRKVQVVWRRKKDVLIKKGVKPRERVIVSRLATPLPNMQLQVGG